MTVDHLLKDFVVVIEIPVAWGEMDSLQHVNNMYYFRYFESVRTVYLEKVNVWKLWEETNIGAILGSAQCRFKSPLTYPDVISIGARVSKVEEDRFVMEFRVVSQKQQKIVAEGEGLIVSYDYVNKRKTRLLEEVRTRILELENYRVQVD